MKRILCVILSLLVLCSCKAKSKQPTGDFSQKPFESDVKITYNDLDFTAFIKYGGINNAVLTITSPKNIEGLTFEKNSEEILVRYDNLEFSLNSSANKYYSVAEIAFSSIPKALSNGLSENFETKIGSDKVFFSFENNTIKEIRVPSRDLIISFYNFKFIK